MLATYMARMRNNNLGDYDCGVLLSPAKSLCAREDGLNISIRRTHGFDILVFMPMLVCRGHPLH